MMHVACQEWIVRRIQGISLRTVPGCMLFAVSIYSATTRKRFRRLYFPTESLRGV